MKKPTNINLGIRPSPTARAGSQGSNWINEEPPLGDLNRILGSRTLVRLALDAVQTVEGIENMTKQPQGGLQPRMMLTLLAYCYASGIYGSRQIADAIRDNDMVRYLCARTYPTEQDLRQFRKTHRKLVEQCLVYILKQTWALRLDEAYVEFLGYAWFESELMNQINRDAYQRIDVATFMDLMETE